MKPTPKADLCIKMIKEISCIAYKLGHFSDGKHTAEYIDLFKKKDKLDLLLSSERERLDNIKKGVDQLDFMSCYRLLPFSSIKHQGSSSFVSKGDDVKEATKSLLINNEMIKPEEFNDFWYIVTSYDEVTIDDLKAEFWEISESIEAFDTSYQIIKLKYNEVYSCVPDPSYYDFFKLMEEENVKRYIDFVVEYKIASKREIERLIFRICNVIEDLNMKINSIVDLYKGFVSDNYSDSNTSSPQQPQQPQHLNTSDIKSKKGRPKQSLKNSLLCAEDKKDDVIQLLHSMIDGKKGKEVGLVIMATKRAGIATKITYTQMRDEFGDIGNQSGYNKYTKEPRHQGERYFQEDEINPIKERIMRVADI